MNVTINIDTTGWTQERKNLIQAIAVKYLYDNGVTYDNISVDNGTITLVNPVGNTSILTRQTISDAYDAWKVQNDAAVAEALAIKQANDAELASNPITTITLAQIDTAINNITDLASAKIFLKNMCKYLKARGL